MKHFHVSHKTLDLVLEAFSDSGHTNIHQQDIIIDSVFYEDRRAELAGLLGINESELPESGHIIIDA